MNTKIDSKSELRLGVPKHGPDGPADREARIWRLLTAFEEDTHVFARHAELPRPFASDPSAREQPSSDKAPRFLLVDSSGPIREFDSWSEAHNYMMEEKCYGASIIPVEPKDPIAT